MLRYLFGGLFAVLAMFVFQVHAAQEGGTEAAAKPDPAAESIQNLALANDLVEYARKMKSPETLLAAASILQRIPAAAQLKSEVEAESGKVEASTAPSLGQEAEALLLEAKIISRNDPAIVALADSIGNRKITRGALGGPKMAQYVLPKGDRHTHKVKVVANEPLIVNVIGAGNVPIKAVIRYHGGGNTVTLANGIGIGGTRAFVPPANGHISITVSNPLAKVPTAYRVTTN